MGTVIRMFMLGITLIATLVFNGCAHRAKLGCLDGSVVAATQALDEEAIAKAVAGGTIAAEQLLVVIAEGEGTTRATLYALERGINGWQPAGGPVSAMIGRSGFAQPGKKREGDGHTPAGLFPLEFVFGYAPETAGKMPYRQATESDIWVDDAQSPDYNTWRKKGETAATSFEEMKLPDPRYRHGVVIGYNRNPVIKGNGSAIFLHVWREDGQSTSGCVAIDEQELVRIIGWLDPAKRPMILMGNRADLVPLPGTAGD
jgi:L,D-peptidoglycan transpeptidase YkuD (ErfK/YbiS/YcfS/YnhG family)